MKKFLRYATNALFAIGLILTFSAVSTSDYYVIELGQNEPQYVWELMKIGVAMMVPLAVRVVYNGVKEG